MITSPPTINVNQVVRVAIPTPLRRLFDYLLPPDINLVPQRLIGARVAVSFGRRNTYGIIIEYTQHSSLPVEQLKSIDRIIDAEPILPASLLELIKWASNYYQYPLGMLFEAVLPAWLRKEKTIPELPTLKFDQTIITNPHTLNLAQQKAVTTISEQFSNFKPFLLDGVTGSGKTEVYMHLIAAAIAQSKQTLMLVPEINLTPQTLKHFEQRFKVPIAVLHSQISEKKRMIAWEQARNGQAAIVLGTRLAGFTPLKNPGLFIIDEEHDLSFKQQDHFRYNARDLLLKRAQIENCPIVLGTATPSLEAWHNVSLQRLTRVELPQRAGNAQKPNFELIDIRHKKLESGLSNYLLDQIKQHLEMDNQVLLFLNRRGYAPVLLCFSCGWHQICQRCDANMILHLEQNILRCHHCLAQRKIPTNCPQCNSSEIAPIGTGTQRLEATLAQHFPNAHITRVDRDTMNNKEQFTKALTAIHDGSANILIGTQMLAKGHHFPKLTLVAIIDIDAALYSIDYRAIERVGQLITQVAGRAGRENKIGHVLLQTSQPDNPLLTTLIYQDYAAFLNKIAKERQNANLPPYSYQVLLRAEAKTAHLALNFLQACKTILNATQQPINCWGPVASPMEKRQGFFRGQLLLQANNRRSLQLCLQQAVGLIEQDKLTRSVRWSIDVDPLDLY